MNAKQLNFAYKVRHALNENLDNLPPSTVERLASSRKIALSFKNSEAPKQRVAISSKLASHVGDQFNQRFSFIARFGLMVPAIVLAAGLTIIYQFEQQQRIRDIA